MKRNLMLLLTISSAAPACSGSGDDESVGVRVAWRTDIGAVAAPPGEGPDGTVVAVTGALPGEIRTLDQVNGITVVGPIDTFFAQHAPIAVGADLFFVSAIGRIVHLNLGGQTLPSADVQLGVTGPMALGADGILRLGSTTGRLFGMRTDGTTAFDTQVLGAVDTAPAIDSQGNAYFALDGGVVVGIDRLGNEVFRGLVIGPASGPSVRGGRLAVGAFDGVYAFDTATGAELFRRDRDARVVGTRWLDSGELVSWGEDGVVELHGPNGEPRFAYRVGPPIYTPVVPVSGGAFGVIDNDGTAYRINRSAVVESSSSIGGIPSRQAAVTEQGWVVVAVGTEIVAVNFAAPN